MKLFVFSDIHQDWQQLKKIVAMGTDLWICLGDLTKFGAGLAEAAQILRPLGEKLWLLPGNSETISSVKKICEENGFVFFHQQIKKLGGYSLAGLGLSNLTPFKTPGERTEEEIRKDLMTLKGEKNLIFLSHTPPWGTELDLILGGGQVGSTAIREFVDDEQPLVVICGHIHENEGKICLINKTVGLSVGREGFIFWI